MSKRSSIGSWAYTIGPYGSNPIDFDTVCKTLKSLGFDGVELGGFPPHPNPGNPNGPNDSFPGAMPEKSQREELRAQMADYGLGFSGLAANLWCEKLINTDDLSATLRQLVSRSAAHRPEPNHEYVGVECGSIGHRDRISGCGFKDDAADADFVVNSRFDLPSTRTNVIR